MCDSSTRPSFIAVPDTAKVVMRYIMNDHEVMNVFYFKQPDGYDDAGVQALAEAVTQSWDDNLAPIQPDGLILGRVEATSLRTDPDFFFANPVNAAGSVNEPILPGNVTLAIKFLTGLTGRSQRGRMFWLQLTEPMVLGDVVNGVRLTAVLGGIEQFFADIATAMPGTDHVVVSYCEDGAWRTEGQTTPVLTYDSDGVVDSQRRRLVGRGR